MSNIKFVRMITGEDVITELSEVTTESFVTFHKPTKIIYTFDGESTIRMQLIPWVFTSLTESMSFDIQRRDILITADASKDMVETFNQHHSPDIDNDLESEIDIELPSDGLRNLQKMKLN